MSQATRGPDPDEGAVTPAQATPPTPGELRWWQRVVPLSGIAVVVLAVAAFALPGLDDEIELSTRRSPQPFVELSLANRPAAVCADGSPRVRFGVQSHLDRRRTLRYRVAVDPAGPDGRTVVDRGRLRLAPGRAARVRTAVPAPAGTAYDVTVRLENRPERLRIHCEGSRR